MTQTIEVTTGEIKVKFNQAVKGKVTLAELGVSNEQLDGGFLRLVFDMEGIGEHAYYAVPTIEVAYDQQVADSHWQCEFNGTTLIDKVDHFGNSTVILLDRKKLANLEQHHENVMILHAELPSEVNLDADNSYINFFK